MIISTMRRMARELLLAVVAVTTVGVWAQPAGQVPASSAPAGQVVQQGGGAPMDEARKKQLLREGQMAWLKLLGLALVFGIVAKILGRSFWRWFVIGAVTWIVLVALDVVSF